MFSSALSAKAALLVVAASCIRRRVYHADLFPLAYRLARGTFWNLAGALISRGLQLAAFVLIARMLGREEFGEVGIIQNTVTMFQTFATLGLGLAATKYVAEFRQKDPAKAGRIIALTNGVAAVTGILMASLSVILAPWLSENILAAPQLGTTLQVSALWLFLGTLTGAQNGALAGLEAFKSIAQINLVSGLIAFPLMLGGAYCGGLEGTVWGLAASQSVNYMLNHMALKSEARRAGIPISFCSDREEWRALWAFSFPAFIGGATYAAGNWACSAMLANQPDGYTQLGFYHAANQWFSVLLFLPGVLGQAFLPVLSELGASDWDRSRKILTYSYRLNAILMLPLVMLGCIASPWIMQLYGEDFKAAWPTLVVTLITAGVCAVQAPAGQLIVASGRMWLLTVMNASWGVVFVMLTMASVEWGSLGLAVSRGIAYLFYTAWALKFSHSLIQARTILK